jgi:hypothetical protein
MKDKTTGTTSQKDIRSNLEKLDQGLLMLGIKRSVDEGQYYAIDRQTFGHHALQTRHTYSSELLRVLNDLSFTAQLAREVSESKETDRRVYEQEDQILYYNGTFYALVHSLKDKLIQLLAVMLTEKQLPKAYKDLKQASVSKFLKYNESILKAIGIYEGVGVWRDQSDGLIGKTLRRRNDYHHHQNRQQLNKDLQDLKTARLMQQPNNQVQLTDYGKQKMLSLEESSLRKIKEDNIKYHTDVLKEITDNIEEISSKLIDHFKIPADQAELGKIGVEYTDFLASLKIKNNTNTVKIQPEAKTMIDVFVQNFGQNIEDQILAIYLVGSCARGEFIPGSSDINFYVITKSYSHLFDNEMPVTLTVLSEEDLLSDDHKKDRFIIWADGLLMSGKAYTFDEKEFPKPGVELCLLLNRGILDRLQGFKEEFDKLKNPTNIELRLFTLKVARMMLDYDYGVAMSNRPFYTANRKEKIAHTKIEFPDEYRTKILEKIYYGARIAPSDLKKLIEVYIESAQSSYAHLLKLEAEFNK